ncbi:hypothetical protein [Hymenobacter swuensis]|nr:hypothetical protein [Hymenobacter swuensis]
MEEHALYGQVYTDNGLDWLSSLLKSESAQVRESANYTTGRYLLISTATIDMTFEQIANTEFLIAAQAVSASLLLQLAHRVSAILATHQVQHRMELYTVEQVEYAYLHYHWPQPAT